MWHTKATRPRDLRVFADDDRPVPGDKPLSPRLPLSDPRFPRDAKTNEREQRSNVVDTLGRGKRAGAETSARARARAFHCTLPVTLVTIDGDKWVSGAGIVYPVYCGS